MNSAELYKMVCEPDETDLDIQIPAVMLPQDAGATLQKLLSNGSSGRNLWVVAYQIEMSIYYQFQNSDYFGCL